MLVDTHEGNRPALNLFRAFAFEKEIKHAYLSMNLDSHPQPWSASSPRNWTWISEYVSTLFPTIQKSRLSLHPARLLALTEQKPGQRNPLLIPDTVSWVKRLPRRYQRQLLLRKAGSRTARPSGAATTCRRA